MSSLLGSVQIKLPKGYVVYGVALLDANGRKIASMPTVPIRPADGDWIQVEIESCEPVVVGKALGCCDCDGEFKSAEEADEHARKTGHNVDG